MRHRSRADGKSCILAVMNDTAILVLRVLVAGLLCTLVLFLNGRIFRRTLPVDPKGAYNSPAFFAQANGAAVLYAIIACTGILAGALLSVWGTYISAGLLTFILAVDILQLTRASFAYQKELSSETAPAKRKMNRPAR